MTSKTAVILVNYKGYDDTYECIDSIKKSTIKADIIVVDNASDNGDYERLKKLNEIILLKSEENLGFAAGNNIGIRYVLKNSYSYVILLNNDTVISANMLELLIKNTDNRTVAVPCMYYFNKKDIVWYGGGEINKKTGNSVHYNEGTKKTGQESYCTFATFCCIAFPIAIIQKIGEMNEEYFMYCEDTEYCLRLYNAGVKIKYIPEAKLWHKVSKSSGGDMSALSTYYVNRNRFYCIKKYPDYFHWTAYPFSLITRYIRMFQFKMKGQNVWKAMSKALQDARRGVTGKINLDNF